MAGWIKISREIANHWIWQDAERLKWWLDLLFLATWEDRQILHDSHLFTLYRGQLIASVSFLSERWGRSSPTIIKYLKMLEKEGMINREVLYRQTSILTICNYDRYQFNEVVPVDTIVNTMVDRQNDEDLGCKVNRLKNDITTSKSNNLGYKTNDRIDTQIDTIVDTNKEYKEYNINNNIKGESKNSSFICELKNSQIWLEQMAMKFQLSLTEVVTRLDDFALDCSCNGAEHQDLNDTRRHFNNWLRIQIDIEKRKNYDNKRTNDKRRGTEIIATSAEDYTTTF